MTKFKDIFVGISVDLAESKSEPREYTKPEIAQVMKKYGYGDAKTLKKLVGKMSDRDLRIMRYAISSASERNVDILNVLYAELEKRADAGR
jgi:hypothetical protein